MSEKYKIDIGNLTLDLAASFVFNRGHWEGVEISETTRERVAASEKNLQAILETGKPIYGVTTGFGDSCFRRIPRESSEVLQRNLINYLLCGTGPSLPRPAAKATLLARLQSLSRGYSGVSIDLIEALRVFVERDWVPVIPREGSLGASGDLVPLAYLGRALQGEGEVDTGSGIRSVAELLKENDLRPYRLKPKEGLALVNGTSAMVGLSLINWNFANFLTQLASLTTAWACVALRGKSDAFGQLVNEKAKSHWGQSQVAQWVRICLEAEDYDSSVYSDPAGMVQDRYSLRCAPQILGPVVETIDMVGRWVEREMNSTSDNPLVDPEGGFATGGNFYGGYLSHGMDYLKISLGHVADVVDRQLMLVVDEKTNRGLSPNLANWRGLAPEERFLHHGLKGLHQSVSAITSEIMAKSLPSGIFSRSSESHNQDKVSLGMSAATSCWDLLGQLLTVETIHLICLAQALDLREHKLKGKLSQEIYEWVRQCVPFVERDQPLEEGIRDLSASLRRLAESRGGIFSYEKA